METKTVNAENKIEFYRQVDACNPNHENVAFIVTDEEGFGEKAICTNGELVWASKEEGCLSAHADILRGIRATGLCTVDGRQVYSEILGHEKKLVICGAGHVSMSIIKIALIIGLHITVIDDRPQFAENARRQGAANVICDTFAQGLAQIPGDSDTYFVIVTRGHKWDRECLRIICQKPHAYVGLMGSSRRVGMVLDGLRAEGISAEVLGNVHTPIGLRIGAETPEEIAVSIMGEIIQVKNRERRSFGYGQDMLDPILGLHHAQKSELRKILTMIVQRHGSAPRSVGTKMLVFEDGSFIGTIGGGLAEAKIMEEAMHMFANADSKSKLFPVDLTMQANEDGGMVCGGTIEVLMEPLYI